MSGIFAHDCAPDTPRSPYKRPSSAVPQATENLLHFNGETYKVPFKPSRRPSQTMLSSRSDDSQSSEDSRPQSAASMSSSSSSSTMFPTSTANSKGMRDVMHHDTRSINKKSSTADCVPSPRKVRVAPGGPTSIILG